MDAVKLIFKFLQNLQNLSFVHILCTLLSEECLVENDISLDVSQYLFFEFSQGSAFRCLKTGDPTDAVLERAARESGVPISDILENLPAELSVWIDPGEVSYRIGEKGTIKILISESHDRRSEDTSSADREVTKTFNPEAQCFRPIDAVSTSMNALSLSPKSTPQNSPPTPVPSPANSSGNYIKNANGSPGSITNTTQASTGTGTGTSAAFLPRSHMPLTFTTASFAATKFGSTKLKTNSKRTNR